MTIQEITTRKEDQTFDCKSIQIEPKALAVPIVAFANADGGVIAIGVSDKTRKIEGIDQHTEKLNELLRVPFDFCNPSAPVTCSYLPCTDKNGNENRILLMEIPASSNLHTNQTDDAFMRVGDKGLKLTFDERVQARPQVNGEEEVSTACVLLFGKYPQKFFPRARTRFIRYEGVDEKVGAEMNVIKDVTFEGTILNQVRKTIEFIETQVREHTFLGQHAQFVTRRDYPEFVIQEMTVNSVCHRAYSIKGTEIQIKMFDDRLVFESPGKLPGMVKPTNIRNTHFSRNPKIAAFLKAYHYVKEYGEGVDRIYRELEANGTSALSFHTDDFILKISVPKVSEKVAEKVTVNGEKVAENQSEVAEKVAENQGKLTEKLIEKATSLGEKLTQNRIRILELMMEDPYISRADLAKLLGISETSIYRNIEAMRGKYLRRVGPDKGGFWEIIS